MVLQTDGAISLGNIQTEFGGTNPIAINEYYRGEGLVPSGSTGVPASGPISLQNFYGARKLSSFADIIGAMRSTNYAAVRNFLLSQTSFAAGLETSTALAQSYTTSATYRYTSSVTGTYTWPTVYSSVFEPLLYTSYLTFVVRNWSSSAVAVPTVRVNGTNYSTTAIFAGTTFKANRLNYVQVPVGSEAFRGLNVSVTYTKGTENSENLQELYILPGRWNLQQNVSGTGPISATVQANDIAIALSAGTEDAFYPTKGNFSGPTFTEVIRRSSRWYDNTRMRYSIMNSAGTLSFSPGTTTNITADSTTTSQNQGQVAIFRFLEP